MAKKVAIWVRVSTDQQNTENQLHELQEWAKFRGFEVTKTYDLTGVSARHNAHAKILKQAQTDARANQFNTLIVWALDRLDRGGPEKILKIVREFSEYGCDVISLQESWTETVNPEMRDLMLAIFGWIAKFESERRSERTKAGLEEARRKGKTLGRPRKKKKPSPVHLIPLLFEEPDDLDFMPFQNGVEIPLLIFDALCDLDKEIGVRKAALILEEWLDAEMPELTKKEIGEVCQEFIWSKAEEAEIKA
jgi:DNA invertase Pin-like site-specific DNA recombinase